MGFDFSPVMYSLLPLEVLVYLQGLFISQDSRIQFSGIIA
jgi:hypothetical protein